MINSCGKNESDSSGTGYPDDGSIQIFATRSTNSSTSTYEGSQLSLSVIYSDKYDPVTDDPYTVIDTKWEKDEDGQWNLNDDIYDATLWRNEADTCSVISFAPYVEHIYASAGNGVTFSVNDRQDVNNLYSSDLMTCSIRGFLPSYVETLDTDTYGGSLSANGTVSLNFTHRLSAFIISLTYGDEFDEAYDGADPSVVSVAVNAYPTVTYKYSKEYDADGVATPDDAVILLTETDDEAYARSDIYAYNTQTNEYCVIVPPQTFTEGLDIVTIKIDTGGVNNGADYKDYILTVPTGSSYVFKSGLVYTMAIRVGKDTVKLDTDSITVSDWSTGGTVLEDDAELDRSPED